ncbi:AbrB/MazE/SpoVT family DNA-binding domain-containing protein [Paramicrobacterium agarici]|uniref:AbrB family looped-hinge helix DNA binding protein n=1 Tax=Paramicrobacterium agarici TaxID=630514 RepID=A0A2A9DTY6_9MICO|nr:AbrB/MazE/SpoVT family DNA-binding domain-containing protein [Microbacterium agarici]PFG30054.1 AbrB family looped-hinge helix DNA binding protein [Microbacterium agarici]
MRSTMDKAGRVVLPAAIRDSLGFRPGPIDIVVDGTGVRLEMPTADNVEEQDGRLVITAEGPSLTADDIRKLRVADQR